MIECLLHPPSSNLQTNFHAAEIIDADFLDSEHPLAVSQTVPENTAQVPEACASSESNESDGFYERDLEILEQMANSFSPDGDSAVYSDRENDSGAESPFPLNRHPKLRRLNGLPFLPVDDALQQKNGKPVPSLRRKSAMKKKPPMPRAKSVPGTPHPKESISLLNNKNSSTLIQEKIKALEQRGNWKNNEASEVELKQIDEMKQFLEHSSTDPNIAHLYEIPQPTMGSPSTPARTSWVTMMVKKIESGVQSL
jgi:hypothetical protein